jgi:REP element-mobilizing transposase RayT
MVRGIEGCPIFLDDQDRQDFVSRISELVEMTGTKVLAWTLMDNHLHLLIFSGFQGISKFMRRLLTGHAVRYNLKYHRSGHLFQNRYKSIVCEEDPYLLELVRYIHLNPLRAGIVNGMEELDQYPWCGHGVLTGRRKNDWQETEYVLKQFSEERGKAVRGYRKFMEEGKQQGRRLDLVGGGLIRSLGGWSQVLSLRDSKKDLKHDARILGGGDFVEDILRDADRSLRRQLKLGERRRSIDQVIKRMCEGEGIREEELRNGGQRREVSRLRAKISSHLSHELGIPMAEIARHVGVCGSAVIKAIQKAESADKYS